ncbi:MAG: glycogen debranching enzyme N-terminal domain-containing protein [Kiritimatiellae bacterium]|nr:glycogen debranching enzyme N-terminal domain-containing protein [Kiritimatiellia bacterium]
MIQIPSPGEFLLKWRNDTLKVTLKLDHPRKGRAAFRTNIGNAKIRRREIIQETERGVTPLAKAWVDIPLDEVAPGEFSADIRLDEVGIFSGKACFFPEGSNVPEWPDGLNTHIKVESLYIKKNNSIYTVFPRQFGSFREIVRRLPTIMDRMGFRIIQTLPPFPVPTSYAVMGEYGCPFAALDFLSVDPAMAEFDEYATPLDQFCELIDAVHARRGLFFVDLPANHTGWASTLQTHHPDWFHREGDGRFVSPGAWGVKWADLVELDYTNSELRAYMADVFLFWCRKGVDGFRCDAGYMIPAETWEYIVARVRDEYPFTVFMLEGLGGRLEVTDALLAEANLDWAYSEIFQTYDRGAFEWYLPQAIERSEKYGTLVHFAETHDNDRLAKSGEIYARLRVELAVLLSWQGAWGIANGVEWYCREKIDVHGKNDLNWGAKENMVDLIAKLNSILDTNPLFEGASHLELVTRGEGNTLAVLRTKKGVKGELLVLANLDCVRGAKIDWDRTKFSCGVAFDILKDKKVDCSSPIKLAPGEVLCLAPWKVARILGAPDEQDAKNASKSAPKPLFHWQFPRDIDREVCVPEDTWVELSAPYHFRMSLIDPKTGKTIRTYRSDPDSSRHAILFDSPHYKGDGTAARRLVLSLTVYTPGHAKRTSSTFLIPPPLKDAKVKLALGFDEIRTHGAWRTILSNGAGASSQMRIGWGEIHSQYDAILAANPNPTCPGDRLNIWTRLRCWLQREGYTRELDKRCTVKFIADPAGKIARWDFHVPCGMGKTAAFTFDVALAECENAARVKITRHDGGADDVGDQVRLVFRPGLEWRSFHSTTKAFAGAEERFRSASRQEGDGFIFAPYDGAFRMRVLGGVYHPEAQWGYNISHDEEVARGQDGSGDIFSPGWISADLKPGQSVSIIGEYSRDGVFAAKDCKFLARPKYESDTLPLEKALKDALELFIVKRDELKTVIAGYPWFLDWGRDTFIFMRGMIAAGMYEDSLKILKAFAAFEQDGTLPNIIYGKTAGNRDTADAQLWFIRCVGELEQKGVDVGELKETCRKLVANYIKGTPNGIKVDPESALVWSPSHFTWMDTNYPACTPRTGYPVEIEALWVSALEYVGEGALAAKAKESIRKYFKVSKGYCDCLDAPNGESAAKALCDDATRPNQLFLITLGVLEDESILEATEELLVPGGIRSLNAEHPLYCGKYEGDEDSRRKPAYHNGTVWAWPFALYPEALAIIGAKSKSGAKTLRVARDILASAVENINSGCLCHMSEIADGDAPHAQKGCTAQAWSISETLRVALKLNL